MRRRPPRRDRPSRFRAAVFGLLAVVFTGGLLVAAPAGATRIVHRNAEELARLADRIFVGTCLSAQERRRGDLFFTEYVFEVEERIKWRGRAVSLPAAPGRAAPGGTEPPVRFPRLVVRQLSAPAGGSVVGLPRYTAGGRYLLMLHADSSEGLTSPVGFAQGAFRLYQQSEEDSVEDSMEDSVEDSLENSVELAVNPLGNLGLFRGMSTGGGEDGTPDRLEQALQSAPTGPLSARRLVGIVRELVAEGKP